MPLWVMRAHESRQPLHVTPLRPLTNGKSLTSAFDKARRPTTYSVMQMVYGAICALLLHTQCCSKQLRRTTLAMTQAQIRSIIQVVVTLSLFCKSSLDSHACIVTFNTGLGTSAPLCHALISETVLPLLRKTINAFS